jgi:hypothetical protein
VIATFVFAGVLVGVLIGARYVMRDAKAKPIDPPAIDASWSSIEQFYAHRPDRTDETEFGHGWTSELDPGASFDLSWISKTSELVALRQQAVPGFRRFGTGHGTEAEFHVDDRATGMKVLAVVDEIYVRACHPEDLRAQPDGLDQLTAKLGCPYVPPHPDDPHWSTAGPASPGDDEGKSV